MPHQEGFMNMFYLFWFDVHIYFCSDNNMLYIILKALSKRRPSNNLSSFANVTVTV